MNPVAIVPVMGPRYKAWPKSEIGGAARYVAIGKALTQRYKTDAHFAAYSVPSKPRRLSTKAAEITPIAMVAVIFDVDGANHEATAEWWMEEKGKLLDLLHDHPGAYIYRTRGGYRVVYVLARPILICDATTDRIAWRALYLSWIAYITRRYGILADRGCQDWTRLFRLPHATRDEGGKPEQLDAIGDVNEIGAWTCQPSVDDIAAAAKRVNEPSRPDLEFHMASDYCGRGRLLEAFASRGWIGVELELGKYAARCPWRDQHTTGEDFDASTVIWEAERSRGDLGVFHCSHSHCAGRSAKDVIGVFTDEEMGNNRDEGKTAVFAEPIAPRRLGEQPDSRAHDNGRVANECSDIGNGRAFANVHSGALRYLIDRQVWKVFDGRRWAQANPAAMLGYAKEVAELRLAKAARIQDSDVREKMVKWALKSCNADRLGAMLKIAASERVLMAQSQDFDQHHDLLCVNNGTVDLRTGELRPHRREDYLTKLTPIDYDARATCPRWDQFLNEVFSNDAELVTFVQDAVGYSLTGHTREHCFFLLYGNGRNGKGRFIRQLQRVSGDAARTTQFTTFTADKAKQTGNTPELAELAGARVVCAGEPDEGVRLSESVIKSLTGEDEVQACKKYEAPFSFVPIFKLWLHTNHKPEIRGTDDGIWRRPRLIPFTVSFEGCADLRLDEKLDSEARGVLAWAIRGAVRWYRAGLSNAGSVKEATAAYRQESDPLAMFIEDCVEKAPGCFATSGEIYRAYVRWCEANTVEPVRGQTLSKKLKARGYAVDKLNGARGIRHVRINSPTGIGQETEARYAQ